MKRLILAAAAGLVSWLGAAAAPAPTPTPTPPVEVREVVYIGQPAPFRMQLRIEIDGRAFLDAWDGYMSQLFSYLDRNGDAVLTREEVERAPTVAELRQQLQGGIFFGGMQQQNQKIKLEDVDTNKDGKVTVDEFADYYRRGGFTPLQVLPGRDKNRSSVLTDALFKQLDRNKDGKLSREEVAGMEAALLKLDENEDELISASELAPERNRNAFFQGYDPSMQQQPKVDESSFVILNPGDSPARVMRQLINRRDKDKNQKLSREEIGLDPATFTSLDIDGDGQLDADELVNWLRRPAELEMVIRLGKTEAKQAKVGMVSCQDKATSLAATIRPAGNTGLLFALGDAQIDLRRGESSTSRMQASRRFFEQQFKVLAGEKGYLDRKEAMGGQAQFFQPLFNIADLDGNDKLTEKELNAYHDLQAVLATSYTVLTISDQGRGLFEMLDSNRDGKLSLREMRSGWARLAANDRNNDGLIAKEEIPHQFQIMLSRGQPNLGNDYDDLFLAFYGMNGYQPPVNDDGPVWFLKMDRNGDGDVSPSEFTGTEEEFKALDTDGDGLISLEEATRADERLRVKKDAKP